MGFLSVTEAARRLGIGRNTAYEMCAAYERRWREQGGSLYAPPEPQLGELPCVRVNKRRILVPEAALERMGF